MSIPRLFHVSSCHRLSPPLYLLLVLPERRRGATIDYQAMHSLRDVAHDGWLSTFIIEQQLEIPSAHSWAVGSSCQGNRYGTEKTGGGTASPSCTK